MTKPCELVPQVLIADDGELRDVRRVLDELGIEVAAPGDAGAERATVLISSARRALASGPRGEGSRIRFHIAVAEKMARSLRRELERTRPDFTLESPVDPEVLRLLVQRALYAGTERRRSGRVLISAPVRCRVGLASRPATLIDLSERGCRLVAAREVERGRRLRVTLPRQLTGAGRLALAGRVIETEPAGEPGRFSHAIAFDPLDAAARYGLRAVLRRHAEGSGALRPRASERAVRTELAPPFAPDPLPPAAAPARRRSPRGAYRNSVLATGGGSAHVLVGRDLSVGGMRVDRDESLAVGDELKLVLHGVAHRSPVLVRACVARDDGEDGFVLAFRDVSPGARSALERTVSSLPGCEPADGGRSGPNVVVSERLEDDREA
jgi:hypothetical protein